MFSRAIETILLRKMLEIEYIGERAKVGHCLRAAKLVET